MKQALFYAAFVAFYALIVVLIPGCAGVQTTDVCKSCTDSRICQQGGGPNAFFGSVEVGLMALVINEPAVRDELRAAYRAMYDAFSAEKITYAQLAGIVFEQTGESAGKWAPLVVVLSNRLGQLGSGSVQVSECDRAFLVDHCKVVLAMVGGGK